MAFIPPSHLPEEMLLIIFSESDIPTLLSLSNVCKKFKRLADICLADKFKKQNVGLKLSLGQEHKFHSSVSMEFHGLNEKNGNFIFKSVENSQLKYYHSTMVKDPSIYKISLYNATQQDDDKSTNLLQRSVGFSVKTKEGTCRKTQNVYRTGNGNSHLKVPFAFTYMVDSIPPLDDTILRGGERWMTPLLFECPPSFFYPNDVAVHRILKSVINYKPAIKKQRETNKTIVSSTKQAQKQPISFSQESRVQEPTLQQTPNVETMHEKKLFTIPLVSSRRWNRGARC